MLISLPDQILSGVDCRAARIHARYSGVNVVYMYDADGRTALPIEISGVSIVEIALAPTTTSRSAIAIPVPMPEEAPPLQPNHATVSGNTTAPDDSNRTCHGKS